MLRRIEIGLLLVGIAAASAASGQGKAAGVKGSPAQFFDADDYPAEALRLGEEGRVVAKLSIDPTGKVSSCVVDISSGSPSLDHTTCATALAKMVFEPARDAEGKPIAATFTLPVRWSLPTGPIDVARYPFPSVWNIETTISVDPAGIVLSCVAKSTPATTDETDPCRQTPVGSQSEFRWVRNGRPVGGTIKRLFRQETVIDP